MATDPKKEVIEQIKSVISSYNKNPNLSDSRKQEVSLLGDKIELMTQCPCAEGKSTETQDVKKERKQSERSKFMGDCMRSEAKGGQGKDMKTCSVEYNVIKGKVKND